MTDPITIHPTTISHHHAPHQRHLQPPHHEHRHKHKRQLEQKKEEPNQKDMSEKKLKIETNPSIRHKKYQQKKTEVKTIQVAISELKLDSDVIEQKFDKQRDPVPEFLLCPITQEVMEEPVIITSCGHTFEGAVIRKWIQKTPECPLCKKQIRNKEESLQNNYALIPILQHFKIKG